MSVVPQFVLGREKNPQKWQLRRRRKIMNDKWRKIGAKLNAKASTIFRWISYSRVVSFFWCGLITKTTKDRLWAATLDRPKEDICTTIHKRLFYCFIFGLTIHFSDAPNLVEQLISSCPSHACTASFKPWASETSRSRNTDIVLVAQAAWKGKKYAQA